MKSSYLTRAQKFADTLVQLFQNCVSIDDFELAIKFYNINHTRPVSYAHGVSRFVIMRADYVIKFDMTPKGKFSDGRAGNCESEEKVYERAKEDGYAYLLAETTVFHKNGLTYSIMPRINGVNNEYRDWCKYCTDDEYEWLYENVNDLHCGNVGYKNNKVIVIDYAWDVNFW